MSIQLVHNGELITSYPISGSSKKWYTYNCSCCGILEEKQLRNLDRNLLCHKCKIRKTIGDRGGKYHTGKHITKFIPKVHYITKFPRKNSKGFSTRQTFIFTCECCHTQVKSSSKFMQFSDRNTLLCQKCRLYGSYNINGTTYEALKIKREQTMLAKYGSKCTSQSKILSKKCQETNIKKYGNICSLQRKGAPSKNPLLSHKYIYNNIFFDSSWELAFYIYNLDQGNNIKREPKYFNYKFNNKTYKYYPDFEIDNKFYEIKSDFLYEKLLKIGTIDNAKYQCMKDNNIIILLKNDINFYLKYLKEKHPLLMSECFIR